MPPKLWACITNGNRRQMDGWLERTMQIVSMQGCHKLATCPGCKLHLPQVSLPLAQLGSAAVSLRPWGEDQLTGDEWMDGRTDGLTDRQTDGQVFHVFCAAHIQVVCEGGQQIRIAPLPASFLSTSDHCPSRRDIGWVSLTESESSASRLRCLTALSTPPCGSVTAGGPGLPTESLGHATARWLSSSPAPSAERSGSDTTVKEDCTGRKRLSIIPSRGPKEFSSLNTNIKSLLWPFVNTVKINI